MLDSLKQTEDVKASFSKQASVLNVHLSDQDKEISDLRQQLQGLNDERNVLNKEIQVRNQKGCNLESK
jgi:septal ring factor EnvC (AmiA/AmiB activator)